MATEDDKHHLNESVEVSEEDQWRQEWIQSRSRTGTATEDDADPKQQASSARPYRHV